MPLHNVLSAIDESKVLLQSLHDPLCTTKQIGLDVLRLDLLHPVISGNKWFKLKYYLQDALLEEKPGVVTFGGPYSNHIAATACAAALAGIPSAAIIRGEQPPHLSPTLQDAEQAGMHLEFVARPRYDTGFDRDGVYSINPLFQNYAIIPAGGAGPRGLAGATEILNLVTGNTYTHILCAVGTATMATGLLLASNIDQHIIGVSVVKQPQALATMFPNTIPAEMMSRFTMNTDYHFGGYARKTNTLINFMNVLYMQHQLPTDFVYTGKLLFAVFDLAATDFFPPSAKILVVHSGGLQGNRSLPPGVLKF